MRDNEDGAGGEVRLRIRESAGGDEAQAEAKWQRCVVSL